MSKTSFQIKENSWLAKIAAKKLRSKSVAMVLGKTIHLHNTTKEQFKDHGYLIFTVKYLWESLRKGYYNNKYEKEAREAEEL